MELELGKPFRKKRKFWTWALKLRVGVRIESRGRQLLLALMTLSAEVPSSRVFLSRQLNAAKNRNLSTITHATPVQFTPAQVMGACLTQVQLGESGASRTLWPAPSGGSASQRASALRFPNSGSAPPGARGPSTPDLRLFLH